MRRFALLSVLLLIFIVASAAELEAQDQTVIALLRQADHHAWLTDWYTALPLYANAEKAAAVVGDQRNVTYARFGRLRGQMQTLSLVDLSESLAGDLESPIAQADPSLRLRGLTVKGDVDLEWNAEAAEADWSQVRELAKQLGEAGWENRATGELGMIAFMHGNTGEAGKMVQAALQTAVQSGDIGGQLRYTSAIANGLLQAGYPQLALTYVERALTLANQHPETGFPYVAYSTKVLTLLRLNQVDAAERVANAAMAQATAGDRRIKEAELLLMLAKIAETRGQRDTSIALMERAVSTARAGNVRRLLADAENDLADAYRVRRDFQRAERPARAAVEDTKAGGNRFNLPGRLVSLAEIRATRGDIQEADRLYQEATDTVEAIMVNVPSPTAAARLIGVMSEVFTGHFRLAAGRLQDPKKAYSVLERARGRALADVLRTFPTRPHTPSPLVVDQMNAISRLQVKLLATRSPVVRRHLLAQLWEAEQRTEFADRAGSRPPLVRAHHVGVGAVQQALTPDETMLEYVLDEPRSYCLVVRRRGLHIVVLPAKSRIDGLVDAFTKEVRAATDDTASATRTELLTALLGSTGAAQLTSRVIVVPDGSLNLLPFDTLLAVNGTERAVVIAPSASVFALLRTAAKRDQPERALLAVGGVPYDRPARAGDVTRAEEAAGFYDVATPSKLPVLATSRAEVMAAAELLGPSSVVLTNEQATESAFKAQKLGDFQMLHFAVHGIADRKFPERTALVLLSDPSAGEDGLLQPREISRLALHANVVVLSACETAAGPTIGQEGVLNLARAFLVAGARSVVTTLWTISDDTSTALMKQFYQNLADGRDVADALMEAKKAVAARLGSPALPTVAAFQVVGVGDSRLATIRPPSGTHRGESNVEQATVPSRRR
jgi:CHAT domain-containing protein/tetratricopeptide (TPR) repeat protein